MYIAVQSNPSAQILCLSEIRTCVRCKPCRFEFFNELSLPPFAGIHLRRRRAGCLSQKQLSKIYEASLSATLSFLRVLSVSAAENN